MALGGTCRGGGIGVDGWLVLQIQGENMMDSIQSIGGIAHDLVQRCSYDLFRAFTACTDGVGSSGVVDCLVVLQNRAGLSPGRIGGSG